MIQVEVPYGEVCPNKNIKAKYDVCKECGRYKSLHKTFVMCHLNSQSLQITQKENSNLLVDFETAFAALIDHFDKKNNYGRWPESDLRQFAECFYELGVNARKEE